MGLCNPSDEFGLLLGTWQDALVLSKEATQSDWLWKQPLWLGRSRIVGEGVGGGGGCGRLLGLR